MPDLLTTAQAAALLAVDTSRVRLLARQGRLAGAVLHGRDWIIPRAAVDDYAASPRKAGQPRKVRTG